MPVRDDRSLNEVIEVITYVLDATAARKVRAHAEERQLEHADTRGLTAVGLLFRHVICCDQ